MKKLLLGCILFFVVVYITKQSRLEREHFFEQLSTAICICAVIGVYVHIGLGGYLSGCFGGIYVYTEFDSVLLSLMSTACSALIGVLLAVAIRKLAGGEVDTSWIFSYIQSKTSHSFFSRNRNSSGRSGFDSSADVKNNCD